MHEDGPATESDSLDQVNRRGRKAVVNRLLEAGLETDRFIPLQDGKKKPIAHDQTDLQSIGGNYGVYAGRGLVLLDLDAHGSEIPDWVQELPETFSVRSPHIGEHRYYAVEGEVGNSELEDGAGSIRAQNQYVVGPGSELSTCTKDWHDCSRTGEGRYTVLHDRPIVSVSGTVFPNGQCVTPAEGSTGDVGSVVGEVSDLDELEAPFDVATRIHHATHDAANSTKTSALLSGRYKQAGYEDRSSAEVALASILKFWLDNRERLVYAVITWAANKQPMCDLGTPRKWSERGESYRWNVIEKANAPLTTYNEPGPMLPFDAKPEISHVLYRDILHVVFREGPVTSRDIARHERIDVGYRQVARALKFLEDEGVLTWERGEEDRREIFYSLS